MPSTDAPSANHNWISSTLDVRYIDGQPSADVPPSVFGEYINTETRAPMNLVNNYGIISVISPMFRHRYLQYIPETIMAAISEANRRPNVLLSIFLCSFLSGKHGANA